MRVTCGVTFKAEGRVYILLYVVLGGREGGREEEGERERKRERERGRERKGGRARERKRKREGEEKREAEEGGGFWRHH